MAGIKRGSGNGRGSAPVTEVNEYGRVCTKCGVYKTWNEFHVYATRKPYRCKECLREDMLPRSRDRHQKIKQEVVDHYGGFCVCCGESNLAFLTIDHVNNDGADHRREIGKGGLHGWLRRNGYPEGYQVLCWNCNSGRQINGGICPHQAYMCTLLPW